MHGARRDEDTGLEEGVQRRGKLIQARHGTRRTSLAWQHEHTGNVFKDLCLPLFKQWADMMGGAAFVGQAAGYERIVCVFLLDGHTPCNQMKDGSAHGMEETSMRSVASCTFF